jgi:hypothetical protein
VRGAATTSRSFASTCSTVTTWPNAPRRIGYSRPPRFLTSAPPLALGADVLAACGSTTSPTPGLVWIFSRCSFLPYQPCQAFFPSCAACSHPAPARKAAMRTTSAYSAPVRTFWRWISASRHAFCASFAERMAEGYAWVVNDCQLSRRIRGKAAAVNSSGVAVAAREVI